MDMLRSSCFYYLFIVFVIHSWSPLCDSRHLRLAEKKLSVNREHLITKNNEEITKLEAPSKNKTKTLSSQAHVSVNDDQINERRSTKESGRVKQASSDKTAPSKRVTRTLKVPKYSKKQPKSDQEQPCFNLDYMQPTTHPPHHN